MKAKTENIDIKNNLKNKVEKITEARVLVIGDLMLDKQQVVSENRKIFIVKELVVQNVIDYYELADRLYISTSSLNKDIKELNDSFVQLKYVIG